MKPSRTTSGRPRGGPRRRFPRTACSRSAATSPASWPPPTPRRRPGTRRSSPPTSSWWMARRDWAPGPPGDVGEDIFRLGALLTGLALGRPPVPAWRLDGPPRVEVSSRAAPRDPRRPRLAAPGRALCDRGGRAGRAGIGARRGRGVRGVVADVPRRRRTVGGAACDHRRARGPSPVAGARGRRGRLARHRRRPRDRRVRGRKPLLRRPPHRAACWRRSPSAPRSSPPPPWPAASSTSAPTTARWWGSASRTGASATARRSARWCDRRRWPPATS